MAAMVEVYDRGTVGAHPVEDGGEGLRRGGVAAMGRPFGRPQKAPLDATGGVVVLHGGRRYIRFRGYGRVQKGMRRPDWCLATMAVSSGYYASGRRCEWRWVLNAFRSGKVMETKWESLVLSGRVPQPLMIKPFKVLLGEYHPYHSPYGWCYCQKENDRPHCIIRQRKSMKWTHRTKKMLEEFQGDTQGQESWPLCNWLDTLDGKEC